MTKRLSIDLTPHQLEKVLYFVNYLIENDPDLKGVSHSVTEPKEPDSPRILAVVDDILSQKKDIKNQSEEEMSAEIRKSRESKETYSTEETMRIIELCKERRFAGGSTPFKA
jgi:hypothetical protein